MSIVKNTSKKIISIGTAILLPDDTTNIKSKAVMESPAIKAMIKRKQLEVVTGAEVRKADEDTKADEDRENGEDTKESKGTDEKKISRKSKSADNESK